jgi:hypothetical protein
VKGRYIFTQSLRNGLTQPHDYSHSVPLFVTQRIANYERQCPGRASLTPRQQAAVNRATRRADYQTPISGVAQGRESGPPAVRPVSGGRQQPGELVPDAAPTEKGGAGHITARPAPPLDDEGATGVPA